MFYLSTYEDALTKGVMRSRSVVRFVVAIAILASRYILTAGFCAAVQETLLTSVSSASFLPPSERFYHLCVYLHVEG